MVVLFILFVYGTHLTDIFLEQSMSPKGSTKQFYSVVFPCRKKATVKGHDFSEAYDWHTVAKWLSATIQKQTCSKEITVDTYQYSFLQQICAKLFIKLLIDNDFKSFCAFQECHGVDELLTISNFMSFGESFTETLFPTCLSPSVNVVYCLEMQTISFFVTWILKIPGVINC